MNIHNSNTAIEKIKEMSRSIFYDIPCYVLISLYDLSFSHKVKKSVRLKFKTMSITCRFHVLDVELTLYISF